MSLSEDDIPEQKECRLQAQSKTWLWRKDLAERYRRSPRQIRRWELAGLLPPGTKMPNGRTAWIEAEIEEHERALVGSGEAA
jgi:hypothetical protein